MAPPVLARWPAPPARLNAVATHLARGWLPRLLQSPGSREKTYIKAADLSLTIDPNYVNWLH
jgi:hypothetical protein